MTIVDLEVYPRGFGPTSRSSAAVVLQAPNRFAADHIRSAYGQLLKEVLVETLAVEQIVIKFRITEAVHGSTSPNAARTTREYTPSSGLPRRVRATGAGARDYSSSQLNQKYNFSNYVIGACNQFAHAVSLQVAENLGALYNPLFIYGGVGLGKTHLVNAIGNACLRRGKSVLMISSESFVNELISALRANRMPQFKSKFRSLDVLIVDDVQFLVGKERTQEEFFHTFNELYQHRKQIIMTSDKLPQELTGLEERLRTRFASGLSVDLQAPDFETRVAILSKKAEGLGVNLPNDVASFISQRIDTNVRELEGALNRVVALASLRATPITLPVAEQAVKGYFPDRRAEVSIESIQRIVGERYSVSLSDILGKRRTQNIAFARQVAMFLCRKLTGCSFPEIGALFGGRDHSTVIHAVRVIEERMKATAAFKGEVDTLSRSITNPA
ncbi:MAG: chromosomal replication initiator protein DnaA [Deltaproteobacteria bacterium]|nr:chromosomal replication initiator protein DnaA [Deltaproteobacteria bacterium]